MSKDDSVKPVEQQPNKAGDGIQVVYGPRTAGEALYRYVSHSAQVPWGRLTSENRWCYETMAQAVIDWREAQNSIPVGSATINVKTGEIVDSEISQLPYGTFQPDPGETKWADKKALVADQNIATPDLDTLIRLLDSLGKIQPYVPNVNSRIHRILGLIDAALPKETAV